MLHPLLLRQIVEFLLDIRSKNELAESAPPFGGGGFIQWLLRLGQGERQCQTD